MEFLTKTRFIHIIKDSESPDISTLDCAYNEFVGDLTNLCNQKCDYRDLYRSLAHILTYLELTRDSITPSSLGSNVKIQYLNAASKIVKAEQAILERSLVYPSIIPKQTPTPNIPVLNWNKEFTKRDLIELITALEYIGAINDSTGRGVPFSLLVSISETMLNITLPNAYKIREEVLSRKTKPTDFLNRLVNALIDRSVK